MQSEEGEAPLGREYRENLLPNSPDSSKLWPLIAPDLYAL
jgi:hypothetical protein